LNKKEASDVENLLHFPRHCSTTYARTDRSSLVIEQMSKQKRVRPMHATAKIREISDPP